MTEKDIEELVQVLRRLVIHDIAADGRGGLPHCHEVEHAIELLEILGEDGPLDWYREKA